MELWGGGGDVSVGTIIPYMGTTPPKDFLACDGEIYNITKYQQLANHINRQFGSYNFFGGDGETTFAVPDLRGEFLRGTGTNSHTNQGSGASVGVHQDATEHIWDFGSVSGGFGLRSGDVLSDTLASKRDSDITNNNVKYTSTAGTWNTSSGTEYAYTSRPTNTSVLYCIKYKSSNDITNATSLDETLLYSGNELKTAGDWEYTLADDPNNYNQIIFKITGRWSTDSVARLESSWIADNPYGDEIPFYVNEASDGRYAYSGYIKLSNNTISFRPRTVGSSLTGVVLEKVVGIKKKSLSTADIAEMAMPSDVYENINRGTSSSVVVSYTAPADGYVSWEDYPNSSSSFMRLYSIKDGNVKCGAFSGTFVGSDSIISIPVAKGDSVSFYGGGLTYNATYSKLKFIYSIGSAKALGLL